ncbi:hypothetical protein BpHYR1_044959 [Brachionus plicatilis]|uniref:Uncharacterized protein n=1 Tax=Brachionus plicatilis TaxID=10195 RepID=A0A3M7S0M9_BRAPC|nr:hypothetical protein BpHYR1_044959 [Brachionus plicatilis]
MFNFTSLLTKILINKYAFNFTTLFNVALKAQQFCFSASKKFKPPKPNSRAIYQPFIHTIFKQQTID